MESDSVIIGVSAILAALALPLISAFSLHTLPPKSGFQRYVRCLLGYAAATVFVYAGYLFQGLVMDGVRIRNFYSGWRWAQMVVARYEYLAGLDQIILIGCIIAFATLFARNYRSRVTTAFRASFVIFMSFDILGGMVTGYAAEQYVMCAVFNIVGALLFGVVCAFCFERLLPTGVRRVALHFSGGEHSAQEGG